ncbi:MAG TPA: multicopper oxidase domain-containing protein [Pseudonocardia sp.]|nr:multicopper oxidase domain-containing protein [Pseudonocardia sp.]
MDLRPQVVRRRLGQCREETQAAGLWWTVNGHLFPDVPMFTVREGDVVHIANSSGDVYPMHLHGHYAVVLARDGIPATGSPWWVDSLDVEDGATSRSSRTTPGSGWTTVTTSRMRRRGWWPT